MPLILPGNVASATAGAFSVDNSVRFNRDDEPALRKTPGSAGNRNTFTISMWVKRDVLEVYSPVLESVGNWADFTNTDTFRIGLSAGAGNLITNRKFRDISAWYHLVIRVDTPQADADNRLRLYVNGVQETSLATNTAVTQDYDSDFNNTGVLDILQDGGGRYFGGYGAEIIILDGTSAAPTEFGEFDEDSPSIWKPKKVSGLTFGTNGFYLDFKDSANLGNDANGGTDFTEVNLAAADQATDTPTNNFCTMNPLDNYYSAATFSEGNCYVVTGSTGYSHKSATIAVTKGKWVMEAKMISAVTPANLIVGISDNQTLDTNAQLGYANYAYGYLGETGTIRNNNSAASYGDTYAQNDIIGVYLDLDNNKLYFTKNGTVQNSGTGKSITAVTSTTHGHYMFGLSDESNNSGTIALNFGGCSAFSISSGNADPNGYGNFEYTTTITGDGASKSFYALCTKNLAEFGG